MGRVESDVLLGNRYRLLRRIATGGMGAVWEAEDTVLHRRVAVKILSESLSSDDQFIERFRREARAAAGLSHPNVAGIFDYGVDDDTHFMVMELIDGETLASRLTRGLLPWGEAVRIAGKVAEALQAAHKAGVVHRDIKPGNIMLTEDGGVKVMDFGIAAAAWAAPITISGTTMGTASYISPEQAAGHRATPASDVYSLGVVLYEMLAGRPPFAGSSPVAVAAAHVHDEPPPLKAVATEDVPDHVAAACHVALAKDPERRPPSAQAFAELLRSADAPTSALPTPEPSDGEPTRVITTPPGTAVLPVARERTPPAGVPVAERQPSPARKRPSRRAVGEAVLGLFAALVILLIALAVILKGGTHRPGLTPSPSSSVQAAIEVPSVVGMKEAEAKQALKDAGLEVAETKDVAGPDGEVVSTSPLAGQLVQPGTAVTLYVGSTPAPEPQGNGTGKGHGNGKGKGGD
jgi:eukaryotic-like serine/threonine-protein kinase